MVRFAKFELNEMLKNHAFRVIISLCKSVKLNPRRYIGLEWLVSWGSLHMVTAMASPRVWQITTQDILSPDIHENTMKLLVWGRKQGKEPPRMPPNDPNHLIMGLTNDSRAPHLLSAGAHQHPPTRVPATPGTTHPRTRRLQVEGRGMVGNGENGDSLQAVMQNTRPGRR